ncbi:hypothetical protein F4808DRAFT_459915 [Astrocystis sublimbata]|nr:hypothetical protein F4808DRAFT_459915 [Astrocystis sublimbata]
MCHNNQASCLYIIQQLLDKIVYDRKKLVADALSSLIYDGSVIPEPEPGVPPFNVKLLYGPQSPQAAANQIFDASNSYTARLARPPVTHLPNNILDPQYDFDFTSTNDSGKSFSRGGEEYTRPCGFRRFALNVLDEYGSNDWLGSSNGPGEWPISYHGTGKETANMIARTGSGFKPSKRRRFHGRGIYSSSDPAITELYAVKFWSHGKTWKAIVQSRVNPDTLRKIDDMNYWVSPNNEDIRPYAICVKEVPWQ